MTFSLWWVGAAFLLGCIVGLMLGSYRKPDKVVYGPLTRD
jgi:hypothetical protein